jgi:hypothetical protein
MHCKGPRSEAFWSAMREHQRPSSRCRATFVLVVEVRGFEPLASSVRVSGVLPLCGAAFAQVAADRQGRS